MSKHVHILVVLVLASAALHLGGDQAQGYSWFQYGAVDVVWVGGQSVRYLSPGTFPPGSDPFNHILAAMG